MGPCVLALNRRRLTAIHPLVEGLFAQRANGARTAVHWDRDSSLEFANSRSEFRVLGTNPRKVSGKPSTAAGRHLLAIRQPTPFFSALDPEAPQPALAFVACTISVIGHVLFQEDFVGSVDSPGVCDSLFDCFAFGLLNGLRAGGGLGDLLPQRAGGRSLRILFDFFFFLIIVVIILNIVFGIIIDTFAQLRDQKHGVEEDTRKYCLICGHDANVFDRGVEGGFAGHVKVCSGGVASPNFVTWYENVC